MGTGERGYGRALLTIARRTRGVRYVRRPEQGDTSAFDLAYVRTGPRGTRPPVVVIPGGPGLGSVLPYRSLRSIAARRGLDLIMVEHRGVGLSRRDLAGRDLPPGALRIPDVLDDIAAVLDREGVLRAHIVGSSYGSYLASGFGVAHPGRVAGMILDSALQSADELDLERTVIRDLLWDAPSEAAGLVRRLTDTGIDQRVLLDVARAAYELGGDRLLIPVLRRRLRHRWSRVWRGLEAYATRDTENTRVPGIFEFDLVGAIGFRELGYGAVADGLPLDPALTYAPLAGRFPSFEGEPFDLAEGVRRFDWPLVLLSGSRDLRTPPAIAARVAAAAPRAVTVTIENGHSALDTHPIALLNAIDRLVQGTQDSLPALAPQLDRLPRRGLAARAPELLTAVLAARP
ncbi:alpha/beta fold hydrolase [Microbacterium caowuchunii]|uniref:alpha/beta fold hydrolase n=1 Tax=Microbacterium caowuchunii TaxID=2614638 RepID=UPI001EE95879|nr:alpha/beta fold hydrolase [Microbacterium caowuchunii]